MVLLLFRGQEVSALGVGWSACTGSQKTAFVLKNSVAHMLTWEDMHRIDL